MSDIPADAEPVSRRRRRQQRWVDLVLGLGLLLSAVPAGRSAVEQAIAGQIVLPLLAMAALHLVVAGLVVFRSRDVRGQARPAEIAQALPAVLVTLAAFFVASPPASWPVATQAGFLAAVLGTIVSLLWLGRSFAVLPSVRSIVATGPYRLVRHPAYACELAMFGLACSTSPEPSVAVAAFVFVAGLLLLRIHIEERILRRSEAYAVYAARVRWRLVPFVF